MPPVRGSGPSVQLLVLGMPQKSDNFVSTSNNGAVEDRLHIVNGALEVEVITDAGDAAVVAASGTAKTGVRSVVSPVEDAGACTAGVNNSSFLTNNKEAGVKKYCVPDSLISDSIPLIRHVLDVSGSLGVATGCIYIDQENASNRVEHQYLLSSASLSLKSLTPANDRPFLDQFVQFAG